MFTLLNTMNIKDRRSDVSSVTLLQLTLRFHYRDDLVLICVKTVFRE